ncbi:MAG TPA: hypothetical protein DCS60_07440, partial [Opitutae bacterium]|nr:hypothetical protein [Opitutae bacterium]
KNWAPQNNRGQYFGWPVTIGVEKQYGRKAAGYLAELRAPNMATNIQLINESTGEIEYTLPVKYGEILSPKVFDMSATYTISIRDIQSNELRKRENQTPR